MYFEIDVKKADIFCHGWIERYPTALDKIQKEQSPSKATLGKGASLLFLLKYRAFCDRYKGWYDNDVEDLDSVWTELQVVLQMGSVWQTIIQTLCDTITAVKTDAAQWHEGITSWTRIRTYDFSLKLRHAQFHHEDIQRSDNGQLPDAIALLRKESSSLENFAQSPYLYVLNWATKERELQATITRLRDENKAMKKSTMIMAKALVNKEENLKRFPDGDPEHRGIKLEPICDSLDHIQRPNNQKKRNCMDSPSEVSLSQYQTSTDMAGSY